MVVKKRRKSLIVAVGPVKIGGPHPVAVQSMTDTPTADIDATVAQTRSLAEAGAELVRWTIGDDASAEAVPEAIRRLKDGGCPVPIIGDFHFNGHLLLERYPDMARSLAKYRINPGNIGKGRTHDANFTAFIQAAIRYDKPVRIGVNSGSLDQGVFTELMNTNAARKHPKPARDIFIRAMVQSAVQSAAYAQRTGLGRDKIILSVKMSALQDMVEAYETAAERCDYPLHLGLTEAGSSMEGAVASAAGLAVLLQQGIGDTIRVSLTPQPGLPRTTEVKVCQSLLQSLGLRYFAPRVISCPGCGRTDSRYYQSLAGEITEYVRARMPQWRSLYPGIERMTIAVMGCVVNGPGESRHADIGISLPGRMEAPVAPVYIKGQRAAVLKGGDIYPQFIALLNQYISENYPS